MSNFDRPPGPKGGGLGHLFRFRKDPLAYMLKAKEEFGDVVFVDIGSQPTCFISDPELIMNIVIQDQKRFSISHTDKLMKPFVGDGLLTSESDFHLRQRRMIQPAFKRQRIPSYLPAISACVERIEAAWRDKDAIDIAEKMLELTLHTVTRALFGGTLSGDLEEVSRSIGVILSSFGVEDPAQIQRAIENVDRSIYDMIERRRSEGERGEDLLSVLLAAQDEGATMSDRQLRDELVTLFVAGHETTATELAWTFYLLASHEEDRSRLEAELAVLDDRAPTASDLEALPFLKNVLTEATRLYPAIWFMTRRPLEDVTIRGYVIPAGTTIYFSQYLVHRDPRFYDEPDVFRPDRWEDPRMASLPRFAYFPFGGGVRHCIGESFAWTTAMYTIARLAGRWRMKLVPDQEIVAEPRFSLRPRNGVRVVLERR